MYARMRVQRRFDFRGVNVFAPADDHVLKPIHEIEIVLRIESPDVAGMEPAVAKRVRVLIRQAQVARRNVRPAHHDFAHVADRQFPVHVVDDAQLDVQQRFAHRTQQLVIAARKRASMLFRRERRENGRRFGQTVSLLQAGVREFLHRALDPFHRHRRRAVKHQAHALQIEPIELGFLQRHDDNGRRQHGRSDAVVFDRLQ